MSAEHIGVKTVFFNKFSQLPFDIYIQLSKEKFVKILNSGDVITIEFINKYVSKKIFEFYLLKETYEEFKELIFDFHSNAKEILVKGRKITVPDNENLNLMMESLGVSPRETRMINEMSTRIVTDLNNEDKNINMLLNSFTSSKERFTYDHSYLTAVMSCQIADQNEWGNNPNKEKLCLAAIIHEMAGESKQSLDLNNQLQLQDLATGESALKLDKVQKLAQQFRAIGSIPIDVVSIIENSLNTHQTNLSPMSCCFIVGHQYVIELYKEKFDKSQNHQIMKRILQLFPDGNLHKQANNLSHAVAKQENI
jgi:hypothetical protein